MQDSRLDSNQGSGQGTPVLHRRHVHSIQQTEFDKPGVSTQQNHRRHGGNVARQSRGLLLATAIHYTHPTVCYTLPRAALWCVRKAKSLVSMADTKGNPYGESTAARY